MAHRREASVESRTEDTQAVEDRTEVRLMLTSKTKDGADKVPFNPRTRTWPPNLEKSLSHFPEMNGPLAWHWASLWPALL